MCDLQKYVHCVRASLACCYDLMYLIVLVSVNCFLLMPEVELAAMVPAVESEDDMELELFWEVEGEEYWVDGVYSLPLSSGGILEVRFFCFG